MTKTNDSGYDVVVVGGGAAGLSGALTLARMRRSVLVIDGANPRNAPAGGVHGLLGNEGIAPAELLDRGRSEVRGYGGELTTGDVAGAVRDGAGFVLTLTDGRVLRGRRLLLATGLVDELPEIDGVAQRWGRDVLHCPYCHGWEVRDQVVGVLATMPSSVHQALLFRQLTADVVFFAHSAMPDAEELADLRAWGITVVDGEVAGLEVADDRLSGVRLSDGTVVAADAAVVAPRMLARVEPFTELGVLAAEHPMGRYVPTDESARVVDGVWAAGNITDLAANVAKAASSGAWAAAQLNVDLVRADTQQARAAEPVAPA